MQEDLCTPKTKQKIALQRWLSRVNAFLKLGDGSNLLDKHYENKIGVILSKETYLAILSHCFLYEQVFRTICFIVSLDLARNKPHAMNWDIRKEGFMCLLRTSKKLPWNIGL